MGQIFGESMKPLKLSEMACRFSSAGERKAEKGSGCQLNIWRENLSDPLVVRRIQGMLKSLRNVERDNLTWFAF